MKQIVQPVSGGPVTVLDVPRPVPGPTEVLVRTLASVISPGTERALTALAQASLLAKARARPDLVRQVARKARTDGLAATRQAVHSGLAQDLPLGYSAARLVVEAGAAVTGVRPGQLVATGGAGKASHAEFQAVPGLLCAAVPDGVSAPDAAFTTIAAIALHALRIAEVGPGSKVVVVGLGLIGQLAARLAMAAGCAVAGIDPALQPRSVAAASGVLALDECGADTTDLVLGWSRGRGADAVLICAAGRSSAAVQRVPALCRDRAAVVVVGDVGLHLDRAPYYQRELSLRFARSYGPGRYEPSYEAWGVDYPAGLVRWSEGRNFEAVLDLLAAGGLSVGDLVTHTFGIADAAAAYRLIEQRTEPYLAIRLSYPEAAAGGSGVRLKEPPPERTSPGVGLAGAGGFASGTLLPALRAAGFRRMVAVTSASGLSARRAAERHGFEQAVSGVDAVLADPNVGVLVIATPHDSHACLTVRALRAGRHVWCEKPVALSVAELDQVRAAWQASGRALAVGFNRRWSPAVAAARQALAGVSAPRLISYRVAAGPVPSGHWYQDRRQGGRLLGEVCHFVDTAQALVGAPIEDVTGLTGGLDGHDAVAGLRFADGSLAVIGYGSATPSAGKERIEVHAGAHRVVIDDFRSVLADGAVVWKGRQDKGHRALAAAFWQAVTQAGPAGPPAGAALLATADVLASMQATIAAAGAAAVAEPRGAQHAARVQALFDHMAGGWAARYAPDGPLTGRLTQLAAVVSYYLPADGRVLELGCGTGEVARHLATSGRLVAGCDIAPRMLRQARAAPQQPGACWFQIAAGWRTLPVRPASVDGIVAASVLEYVPQPAAVLAECARVLRPGGIMVCTVPDPAHPVRWLEWLAALVPRTLLPLNAPAGPIGSNWTRVRQYVCYLQTSRHRRSAQWWAAAAARAGLHSVEPPAAGARRAPLRLLIFQRPGLLTPVPAGLEEVE